MDATQHEFGSVDPNHTHLPLGVFVFRVLTLPGRLAVVFPHRTRGHAITDPGCLVRLGFIPPIEIAGDVAQPGVVTIPDNQRLPLL